MLKWLVIVLMLVMIGGVITVTALLVTRMPQAMNAAPAAPTLPEQLRLPEGTNAAAVTFGKGWIIVVTEDDRILTFTSDGQLQQDLPLSAE